MAVRAAAKGIELSVSQSSTMPPAVIGDPSRVRQILINLLGNAVKFTERGSVRMSVKFGAPAGQQMMTWEIADTGVGIPKDQLSELFQDFSQGDRSISRRFGGTGLGLAICRRLARLMGGTISLESEVGKGTVVRFSLPVEVSDRLPDTRPPTPPVSIESIKHRLAARPSRVRILLAEDNPANQMVVTAMLRDLPIKVDVVGDEIGRAHV